MKKLCPASVALLILNACATGNTVEHAKLDDLPPDVASKEEAGKDQVSIEAKLAGAQLGTPYVTEVKFTRGSINLALAELKKMERAYAYAAKTSTPTKTTIVVWSDSEAATEQSGDLSKEDIQLAQDRGESILKYLSFHQLGKSSRIVNMAQRPTELRKFLKTRGARVQEALESSGNASQKASKAILLIATRKNQIKE